ncbi:TetR/AcrR family transcriptional regulator [Paenarthrobacter sp. NPDC089675]|uniref:TetR/AcrR family transcriptional regulator n=1 Tax=Paenarthrobacter TaxID=1742992 RepID=UPI003829950D
MRAEATKLDRDEQPTSLSRQQILRIALQVVDEQGLSALSIRRIADVLGVYPTAVTWHVGTKSMLLEATAALLFDDLELPDDRAMTWDEWLYETAHRWRNQLRQHPNLAPIIGNQLTVSPPALPFVERILRVLTDAGLRDQRLLHSYNAFIGCLIGWVSLELSNSASSQSESETRFDSEISQLNKNLFPAVTGNLEAIRNQAFMVRWADGVSNPLNSSFDAVITMVIQGIKGLASESR